MKIQKHEIINYAGDLINEDKATLYKNAAWVMDGATGLNKHNPITRQINAKWYVAEFDKFLRDNIHKNIPLSDIIHSGILYMKQKYDNFDVVLDNLDFPSSCIAITRWNDKKLEYLILGDCEFYIKNKLLVASYSDMNLKLLDDKAICEMKKIMDNEGVTSWTARNRCNNILIKHRLLKNTKQGYYVLEFNPEAATRAISGEIDINEGDEILIASDGFLALIDSYDYTKIDHIFNQLNNGKTLNDFYSELRSIENIDALGYKYPRFKKHDDSSCVYIKF